jgi:hypothetical protein
MATQSRLKVSDSEFYNVRRDEDEDCVSAMLSPYSCLRQLRYTLDKNEGVLSIFFQGTELYKGVVDAVKIRETLERSGSLDYVEFVTLLAVLEGEPYVKRMAGVSRKPFEKIAYSLAYDPPWEFKRKMDEMIKDTDLDELISRLFQKMDGSPHGLRDPMADKIRYYVRASKPKEPPGKNKKSKKRKNETGNGDDGHPDEDGSAEREREAES